MKRLEDDDGIDGPFERAWDRAMREDAARRAGVLPARKRQRIPVVKAPTGGQS